MKKIKEKAILICSHLPLYTHQCHPKSPPPPYVITILHHNQHSVKRYHHHATSSYPSPFAISSSPFMALLQPFTRRGPNRLALPAHSPGGAAVDKHGRRGERSVRPRRRHPPAGCPRGADVGSPWGPSRQKPRCTTLTKELSDLPWRSHTYIEADQLALGITHLNWNFHNYIPKLLLWYTGFFFNNRYVSLCIHFVYTFSAKMDAYIHLCKFCVTACRNPVRL